MLTTVQFVVKIVIQQHEQAVQKEQEEQAREYLENSSNAITPDLPTEEYQIRTTPKVLVDSGADKSFVSTSFASMLNIPPITVETFYNIEMADGNLVGTNTVIQGFTLTLLNQPFEIDLMPIKLGSFDVVIGMDWLSKYHVKSVMRKLSTSQSTVKL
ncbi:putative reverse transcriptase domain-containing protein [Tanacetum coccineum]|uniref:Reverse transcriptase domain-containing protein n=1 Tax=Tanacetum coccineum TaxID=301880 RepID=A0ABQ5DFG7_9ASTR